MSRAGVAALAVALMAGAGSSGHASVSETKTRPERTGPVSRAGGMVADAGSFGHVSVSETKTRPERTTLLGLLSRGTTSELVRVEPRSLRLLGPRVPVGLHDFPWSRSPDGTRVVLGSGRARSVRFVDVRPLRGGRRLAVDGFVAALAWVAPRRALVIAAGRCCPQPLRALVVDPERGILRRRLVARGGVIDAARSERGIVLLLGGQGRIRPARLAVVGPEGGVRSVELPGVRAGSRQLRPRLSEYRTPGLAVDRTRGRAFVVGASPAVVAEVHLGTLRVTYHRPVERRLADGGNAIGVARRALWLDGALAVTGHDDHIEGRSQVTEPAGLNLVDTRDWSSRELASDVHSAARAGGLVVGWGLQRAALVAYARDGRERLRIVRTPAGGGLQLAWPYAYRGADDAYRPHRADVIDLRTGRIARARVPGWLALLGDDERLCWC